MNGADIQAKYDELGLTGGWSFQYTPGALMSKAKVAFVGMNPGGPDASQSAWDHPTGNAYATPFDDGRSGRTLQRQVLAIFKCLDLDPSEVFTAQFVPFRSRNWYDLAELRKPAIKFAEALWACVLKQSPARLMFCCGINIPTQNIARLCDAKETGIFETGRRNCRIYRYEGSGRIIIGLSHLSRYAIFDQSGIAESSLLQAIRTARVDGLPVK